MKDIWTSLMLLPFLVVGLVVHECAHALAAKWLGDHFPRRNGRISLNPFRHMTLLGTAAILVLPFGWARPVLVNPYNFRRPRRDMLLTALAGPVSNVLLAGLAILAAQFTRHSYVFGEGGVAAMELAHLSLWMLVLINTILAVVNLLPIPPLDGSRIWPLIHPGLAGLFRGKYMLAWVIVLVLTISGGWLDPVFDTVLGAADRFVPRSDHAKAQAYMEETLADVSGTRKLPEEELLLAQHVFDAAIERSPNYVPAWRGRAMVCERREDWAGATEAWRRVCELDPKSPTRDADLTRQAMAESLAQLTATTRQDDAMEDAMEDDLDLENDSGD